MKSSDEVKLLPLRDENANKITAGFKVLAFSICIGNLFSGISYSILAPFFPQIARERGVNSVWTGVIFGTYEIVVVIFVPVYGIFLKQLGVKYLFITGLFILGSCGCLFGFLDKCPPGAVFIFMCLLLRVFQAMGAAAFSFVSNYMLVELYGDKGVTLFSLSLTCNAVGFMVGPPIGGIIFQYLGFKMVFIIVGLCLCVISAINFLLFPELPAYRSQKDQSSILNYLKYSKIWVICYFVLLEGLTFGFLDVTLSIFLSENFVIFVKYPVYIGFVFMLNSLPYSILAVVWGKFIARYPSSASQIITTSYVIAGVGLCLVDPSLFFPIKVQLWMSLLSLSVFSLGYGSMVVSVLLMKKELYYWGHEDSSDLSKRISTIFTTFFSMGAFVGPIVGGFLAQILSFSSSSTVMGGLTILAPLLYLIHSIWRRRYGKMKRKSTYNCKKSRLTESEETPLID